MVTNTERKHVRKCKRKYQTKTRHQNYLLPAIKCDTFQFLSKYYEH